MRPLLMLVQVALLLRYAGAGGSPPDQGVMRCERDRHVCTPYFRCDEADIISDRFPEQDEEDFETFTHSECTRFAEVCCTRPRPSPDPPTPEPSYQPQCGRRNQPGLGARIVGPGGGESRFGEFPWMAAVLRVREVDGEDRTFFECGGSLVHPQVVLTAAHCVHDLPRSARLFARLGEWDARHESEHLRHVDVAVLRFVTHDEFSLRHLTNDVALLFLVEPVQLQDHIDTLCLPEPGWGYEEAECVTTGWGKDAFQSGQLQSVLRYVELPLVPHASCQHALRRTRLREHFSLDHSFTCAGGVEGRDTCTGDGGSPLACRYRRNPERYVQLGVVSWGIGCGLEGVPGVYADVAQQVRWIRRQVIAAGLSL